MRSAIANFDEVEVKSGGFLQPRQRAVRRNSRSPVTSQCSHQCCAIHPAPAVQWTKSP
jgi:hypothetical protein